MIDSVKDNKIVDSNENFKSNLDYIIENLENNLNNIQKSAKDTYFELSKMEAILLIKETLNIIKTWQEKLNIKEIVKDYKKVESNISELELCFADYDDTYHFSGISYSLFDLGKLLKEVQKI